jgi:hypothetical protein
MLTRCSDVLSLSLSKVLDEGNTPPPQLISATAIGAGLVSTTAPIEGQQQVRLQGTIAMRIADDHCIESEFDATLRRGRERARAGRCVGQKLEYLLECQHSDSSDEYSSEPLEARRIRRYGRLKAEEAAIEREQKVRPCYRLELWQCALVFARADFSSLCCPLLRSRRSSFHSARIWSAHRSRSVACVDVPAHMLLDCIHPLIVLSCFSCYSARVLLRSPLLRLKRRSKRRRKTKNSNKRRRKLTKTILIQLHHRNLRFVVRSVECVYVC